MYVCMYVCLYVCMYVYMYVCMYVLYVYIQYVCMYVCFTFLHTHVCIFVSVCIIMWQYNYMYIIIYRLYDHYSYLLHLFFILFLLLLSYAMSYHFVGCLFCFQTNNWWKTRSAIHFLHEQNTSSRKQNLLSYSTSKRCGSRVDVVIWISIS